MQSDIDSYKFDGFSVYVNRTNGKSIAIPSCYEEYKEGYFSANDFFANPVINNGYGSFRICLNLTSNCNLRCKYCFNKEKRNDRLSFEDCSSFITDMIETHMDIDKFFVDLSGSGEPLLELKNIIKIAQFCEKLSNKYAKEIVVQFICNGTLLTNSIARILKKNYVLFGISLDGIKKQHDKNRIYANGKGTFDEIIKNYHSVRDKSFIGAGMTYSAQDYPELFDSYMFLASEFDTFSCRIARDKNITEDQFLHLKKEYLKLKDYILNEIKNENIHFLKQIMNGDDYFGRFILKSVCDAYVVSRCDGGRGRLSLGTDRKVYVCSSAVATDLTSLISDKYDECFSCRIIHTCGGECMVKLVSSPSRDEYMCRLKKLFYEMSLEICGFMQIYHKEKYSEIVRFADEILERQAINPRLKELYPYIKNKYDFVKLKNLFYSDKKRFDKLYLEYIK